MFRRDSAQSHPLAAAPSELFSHTAKIASGWPQSLNRRPGAASAAVDQLHPGLGGPPPAVGGRVHG